MPQPFPPPGACDCHVHVIGPKATFPLACRFATANPEQIVWGSDWPHTPPHTRKRTVDDGEMPFQDIDTRALLDFTRAWFDDALRKRLLVDNPARLYDFA